MDTINEMLPSSDDDTLLYSGLEASSYNDTDEQMSRFNQNSLLPFILILLHSGSISDVVLETSCGRHFAAHRFMLAACNRRHDISFSQNNGKNPKTIQYSKVVGLKSWISDDVIKHWILKVSSNEEVYHCAVSSIRYLMLLGQYSVITCKKL
ncbi:hypothetical protein PV325_005022 [Microctonus aethiopoides]|nr:hypothetical protein PV325_005022 [Microctonus aethiopoides]